jgi:hypothetical protein
VRAHAARTSTTRRPAADPMHARRPNYLSHPHKSLDELLNYSRTVSSTLHFLVLLRDPVDRAYSEYCMFSPSSKKIESALRTRRTCTTKLRHGNLSFDRNCAADIKPGRCTPAACNDDEGNRWHYNKSCGTQLERKCRILRAKGLMWQEFRDAAPAFAQHFPEAMTSNRQVNRTWLRGYVVSGRTHEERRERKRAIQQLVLPWVDPGCSDIGWGWDFVQGTRNFTTLIEDQFRTFSTGTCPLPPRAALSMTEAELRNYTFRCHRPWKFAYAAESVPVFQLALFLKAFESIRNVKWVFLQQERLIGDELNSPDLAQLVQMLGLTNSSGPVKIDDQKACRSSRTINSYSRSASGSKATFDRPRVAALFEPWHRTLKDLVLQSRATHGSTVLFSDTPV